MMNEFTPQNSCKHADELVSYLYDEASEAERYLFEVHLVNCSSCADELADFSTVRSSIVEWRDQEFTPLAIPAIQLPVQKVTYTPEISESHSLTERLRALFSLSPVWAGAAAVLVICVGLLLFAVNFQRQPETARGETEATTSPTKEESVELRPTVSEDDEKSSASPTIAVKNDKSKAENVAVKNKKVTAEKSVRKTKPVFKKSNQSPPPTLLADEDVEDHTLRLSDLFKEVGSR